jgi:hypothetical protein
MFAACSRTSSSNPRACARSTTRSSPTCTDIPRSIRRRSDERSTQRSAIGLANRRENGTRRLALGAGDSSNRHGIALGWARPAAAEDGLDRWVPIKRQKTITFLEYLAQEYPDEEPSAHRPASAPAGSWRLFLLLLVVFCFVVGCGAVGDGDFGGLVDLLVVLGGEGGGHVEFGFVLAEVGVGGEG